MKSLAIHLRFSSPETRTIYEGSCSHRPGREFKSKMADAWSENNLQKCYFSAIPDEIHCKIFGFLDLYELLQIAQVCKRWSELTKTFPLWKSRVIRKIGHENWLVNPIGELVKFTDVLCKKEEQFHNHDEYAYEDGGHGPRSQISLLLRLNPVHKELTMGSLEYDHWVDLEPDFQQALEKIWSTFGRHACVGRKPFINWGFYESDEDSDNDTNCGCTCTIVSAENALEKRKLFTKQEALQFILDTLDPGYVWSSYMRKDKFILNEKGDIEEQTTASPSKNLRYKYKRITPRLYSKVRELFADDSSHFMMYNLSDACFSLAPYPYDCYATQLLVSETAAFFYNQFYSIL